MTIGVYAIIHKTSRQFYVGSSINVEKRLIQHKSKLNNSKHHCRHLQNAWNAYGANAFEFVLKCATKSEQECREIEQAVLDTFFSSSYNSKNMAVGGGTGDANVMRNPEIARKVSEARLGIKFSDEHRINLSNALKGKPSNRFGFKASDATKEKMRKAKLGKPSPRKGCVLSAEIKAKISASKTGKKKGKYTALTCPHCGKVGAGGSMRQWHFDKCKLKE